MTPDQRDKLDAFHDRLPSFDITITYTLGDIVEFLGRTWVLDKLPAGVNFCTGECPSFSSPWVELATHVIPSVGDCPECVK